MVMRRKRSVRLNEGKEVEGKKIAEGEEEEDQSMVDRPPEGLSRVKIRRLPMDILSFHGIQQLTSLKVDFHACDILEYTFSSFLGNMVLSE